MPAPLSPSLLARSAALSLNALALVGLASGCAGSTFVPSSPVIWPEENDGCVPAVTRIEAIDEPTPLGFSAIDALMRLAGPRSSELVWFEPASNDEYLLTLGPEQGRSTLEIDVRVQDGPILHRFRTPRLMAPEDTECDAGAIEIPVAVTLASAAQGLSESFDAVLAVRTPYRGHLSKQLEPRALRGSLALAHVASLDRERKFWLGPLRLEVDVWEGGSAGVLSLDVGASHAEPADDGRWPPEPRPLPEPPVQPGSIAAWPSATACDGAAVALPSSAKVLGFSVDDVLDELGDTGPRRATWSDGSQAPLELELRAPAAELCQRVSESLSFEAMLRARSADGIDVRSPVMVEALDAGGRVGAIRIESVESGAASATAPRAGSAPAGDGEPPALVAVQWTHDGAHDSGSLSLRGADATGFAGASVPRAAAGAVDARW